MTRSLLTVSVWCFVGLSAVIPSSSDPPTEKTTPMYLSESFTGTDAELTELKAAHARLKGADAMDAACVYLGEASPDEGKRRADLVHAHLPGVRVVVDTSRFDGTAPSIFDAYRLEVSATLQPNPWERSEWIGHVKQTGAEILVRLPSDVNTSVPPEEARSLAWRMWKRGMLRLEFLRTPTNDALRAGVEDADRLQVLADSFDGVRRRKNAEPHRALLDEAKRFLGLDFLDRATPNWNRLDVERRELERLIAEFEEVLPKTEQWDAGAYTLAKAVETRLAAERAARRTRLRDRHRDAAERLGMTPLTDETWDALWSKRILFRQDFESEGDWEGQLETENVPTESRRALEGRPIERYHARFIRVGVNYDHARAATTTWVSFKYFLNKTAPVEIMIFDLTQGDNHAWNLQSPVVGKWTEAMLKVTGGFYRKDGSSEPMRAGDAIDDLFFSAGIPGDTELTFLLDDVVLIGLD